MLSQLVNKVFKISRSTVAALGVVSFLLLGMGGCSEEFTKNLSQKTQEITQTVQDVNRLSQDLSRQYQGDVGIKIGQNYSGELARFVSYLEVTFNDSSWGKVEEKERGKVAKDVVSLIDQKHPRLAQADSLYIVFINHREYGPFSYTRSYGVFAFQKTEAGHKLAQLSSNLP